LKTTCNDIGTRTELVPTKLGSPFVYFIRDDDSVANNCEASKSSSLSDLNTATTESAPMPRIFGNITLIDSQPSSTSISTTTATAATACGNVKAEPNLTFDDEACASPTVNVTMSSCDGNRVQPKDLYLWHPDFSKQFNNHFDSDESDDDMKGYYNLFAVDKCEDDADCPFCNDDIDFSGTDDGCEWSRCSWVEWANGFGETDSDDDTVMTDSDDFDSDVTVIETEVELDKSVEPPENEMSLPLAMREAAFQNNATTKPDANLPRLGVQVQPNTSTASLVTKPEDQLETVPKEFEVTPRKSKTVRFADQHKTIS